MPLWHASPSAPSCSAEALQCWDTDSFLPRKGKLLWCGIPPKLQCILLPCCSLAALLRVSDFSFLGFFFKGFAGCWVPSALGAPSLYLPAGKGASTFYGFFLHATGEALQKDPVDFCILSPQGLAGVALLWSPAAPVLLPAQDMPRGTPSHCHSPACPAVTHNATHNW